ncbi:MAG: hypothetical protein JW902_04450 [Syntrophaceae bacterium]|nr:hypothetical protein [Syntrophaceae bacterium]
MPRDFIPPDNMPSEKWLDLVVWVPKYYKANVGHAAMKIRSTDIKGKTKRLDYISWWPIDDRKGIFTTRDGGAHTYQEDKTSEIDLGVRIVLFMVLFYKAYTGIGRDGKPILSEALRKKTLDTLMQVVWQKYASDKFVMARWKSMGLTENFGNLGALLAKGKIRQNPNVQLSKESKFLDKKGILDYGNVEYDGVGFSTTKSTVWMDRLVREIGKNPNVKFDLPCAHLRELKNTIGHIPVWGLSQDFLRLSWVIFREKRDAEWYMFTNKINCASVVWNRMVDGFMDAFVAVPSKPIIEPNGVLAKGRELLASLLEANQRQQYIQTEIDKNIEDVRDLAVEYKFNYSNNWRKMLTLTFWKQISSRPGHQRPSPLTAIDKLVEKYEREKKKIKPVEEKQVVEAILIDERKYLDFKREVDVTGNKLEQMKKAKMPAPLITQKVAEMHKDIRSSQEETTRAYLMKNFDYIKAPRQEMARLLVKIQKAVYTCLKSLEDNNPRRPAVLLLGHCAACAFYEAAHLGEYVDLIDPQKDGAIVCLPSHQFIHYSGPIIEPSKQAEKLLTDGMQTVLKNVVSQTIN